MLVTMTVMVSSNLAGVAVGGLTFSADSDTLAVTTSSDSFGSLIAMALGSSARCTSAIIVNESMTVDGVGGEVVAVTVGVCVSVKNWVIVSLRPFAFGGIAWTIICNVYSVVVNVASF